MKRRWVVIFAAIILALTGCVEENEGNSETKYKTETQQKTVTYAMGSDTETVRIMTEHEEFGDLRELVRASEIVVYGSFIDDPVQTVTYAYNDALDDSVFKSCVTKGSFFVTTVYKGNVTKHSVITIAQDCAFLDEGRRLVSYSGLKPMKKGDRWMYFLKYDEEAGAYRAVGDIYGRYAQGIYPTGVEDNGLLDASLTEQQPLKNICLGLNTYRERRKTLYDAKASASLSSASGYEPERFRTEAVLPEVFDYAKPEDSCEEMADGVIYHVGTLGVDISVPAGYYIYHIKGEYLNPGSLEHVRLGFVDEYVITDQPVGEERLIDDLREPVHIYRDSASGREPHTAPDYVVFDFRVFLKEHLPVENLFLPVADSTCEYYSFGDFFCGIGRCNLLENGAVREPGRGWIAALTGAADDGIVPCKQMIAGQGVKSGSLLLANNISPFLYGQNSYMCTVDDWEKRCGAVQTSVFDEVWWRYYTDALKELTIHPYDYSYPDIGVGSEIAGDLDISKSFSSVAEELTEDGLKYNENDEKIRHGWTCDSANDHELRAWAYACRRRQDIYTDLTDIMILTNTVEGTRLFGVLLLDDEDVYGFSVLEWGRDMVTEVNFEQARFYVSRYFVSVEEEERKQKQIERSIKSRVLYDGDPSFEQHTFLYYGGVLYRGYPIELGKRDSLIYNRFGEDEYFFTCLNDLGIAVADADIAFMESLGAAVNNGYTVDDITEAYIYSTDDSTRLVMEYVVDNDRAYYVVLYKCQAGAEDYERLEKFLQGEIKYTGEGFDNPLLNYEGEDMPSPESYYDSRLYWYTVIPTDEDVEHYVPFLIARLDEDEYLELCQPVDAGYERLLNAVAIVHEGEELHRYLIRSTLY